MPDPDLEISGGGEGGRQSPTIFFGPSGLLLGLKMRGGTASRGSHVDPPLETAVFEGRVGRVLD